MEDYFALLQDQAFLKKVGLQKIQISVRPIILNCLQNGQEVCRLRFQ